MKKILSFILIFTLLTVILTGCTQKNNTNFNSTIEADKKISIVTTIFPIYDFVRAIAGDKVDLTMLVRPGAEIHSFDPSPADIIKIQKADVFAYIGGENDQWVNTILDSMDTSSKKTIKLINSVAVVTEETVEGMEAGHHSHGDEDEHDHKHDEHEHEHDDHEHDEHEGHAHEEAEYDEHIWTSPENAVLMINAITDALCEADSKNADIYKQNAVAYIAKLQELDSEIREIVDSAKHKLLVFGDRFPFRYFADEYELEYRAAFNGCSTETEASAGTLSYLIDFVKKKHVSYIFCIELSNQNIARSICEQTGTEILLLHSCQNISKTDFEAGATYLSLMKQNAENLRKGLN